MSKSPQKQAKEKPFEETLRALETVVSELESGALPIEKALEYYEKGVGLSRVCLDKLDQIQKKIEVIKIKDSKIELVPLDSYTTGQ